MKRKIGFSAFILILGFSIVSSLSNNNLTTSLTGDKNSSNYSLNYVEHAAISITHDDNFTDLGFSGTGNSNDPFVISNLSITTSASRGIEIVDTTVHFVISSCYMESDGYGIEIDNAAPGTVTIINCTMNGNTWDGIYISDTESVSIINSTITSNDAEGIKLNQSPGALIFNNTVEDNAEMGISLWHSSNSTLIDNTMVKDAIYLYDVSSENYGNFTMSNNLVNGKDVGYFVNTNDLSISNPVYGQLILISCQRPNISNQILSDGAIGMFLYYSDDAIITNNTCNNNAYRSIVLDHSDDSIIKNNTCNGNENAIYLVISLRCSIVNNTCINSNVRGISLQSADESDVINNTVQNSGFVGIYVWSSDDVVVTNNTCEGATNYGIYLQSTNTAIITYNQILDNGNYGI
ncbi:MAG: right-handed parallel beta-helix repeat-containing protein, partial [Candidatus Heimdallarchaeaceae archaeon]